MTPAMTVLTSCVISTTNLAAGQQWLEHGSWERFRSTSGCPREQSRRSSCRRQAGQLQGPQRGIGHLRDANREDQSSGDLKQVCRDSEIRSGNLLFHYLSREKFRVITRSNHGLSYALVSSLLASARESCLVCHQNMADRDVYRTRP